MNAKRTPTARRILTPIALGGLFLIGGAGLARADGPKSPPEPEINLADLQARYESLLPSLEKGQRPEAADQLMMLLFSTSQKPLPGWYGPGKSRYDWIWLAARFDGNRDGRVRREEFRGPDPAWGRLDRDGDGVVTADDLDWSDTSEWGRQEAQAQQRFRALDADGDGRLTAEEWAESFREAAGKRGELKLAEFRRALMGPRPRSSEPALTTKSRAERLAGVLKGDVGSFNEGPQVGDRAPDFALKTQDGKGPIALSHFRGTRPVVLTFGSYTCPPYRSLFGGLEPLREAYGDQVEFLAVYVREAHPVDGWVIASNGKAGIEVTQPTSPAERLAVAGKFCASLKPSFPVLIDGFDDRVGHAYSGMPNRLYLIDRDGRVAYKSGRGPRGYKVGELEQSIVMLLMDQEPTSAAASTSRP